MDQFGLVLCVLHPIVPTVIVCLLVQLRRVRCGCGGEDKIQLELVLVLCHVFMYLCQDQTGRTRWDRGWWLAAVLILW